MPLTFAVTWDYRCPFARNAHEHVLDALADGADWDVTFLPFSLGQVHVEEGQPDVWDNPDADSGLPRSRWAWPCGTPCRTGSSTSTGPCSTTGTSTAAR